MDVDNLNSERIRKRNRKIILIAISTFVISIIIVLFVIIALNENIGVNGDST